MQRIRRKQAPIWPGVMFGAILAVIGYLAMPKIRIEKQSADETDVQAIWRVVSGNRAPKPLP